LLIKFGISHREIGRNSVFRLRKKENRIVRGVSERLLYYGCQ